MLDAFVIQLLWDEGIAELPQPQLHERREHMRVVHAVQGIVPSIDTELQTRHRVIVAWHAEYALSFSAPERQNAVRKKRKDDGDFLMWVVALLEPDDSVQ